MSKTPMAAGPVRLSVPVLGGAVAAALLVSGALVASAIQLLGADAERWRGFAAGTVAMGIAAAASIVPLVLGSRFGLMGVVGGFFASSFVRALVAGGICMLAIIAWDYPAVPTLLTMVVHYLGVLTAESVVVGRVLWKTPSRLEG